MFFCFVWFVFLRWLYGFFIFLKYMLFLFDVLYLVIIYVLLFILFVGMFFLRWWYSILFFWLYWVFFFNLLLFVKLYRYFFGEFLINILLIFWLLLFLWDDCLFFFDENLVNMDVFGCFFFRRNFFFILRIKNNILVLYLFINILYNKMSICKIMLNLF